MKFLAMWLIKAYQLGVSPFLGSACRFYPSCSNYAYTAFQRHGFFRGFWLAICRICKCSPWHPGGFDDVP